MVVLSSTHRQFVELLERRIAELVLERDFYRERYTAMFGPPLTASAPVSPERSPSDDARGVEYVKAWSVDDRDLFAQWAQRSVPPGEDALAIWKSRYGAQSPLEALTI